MFGSIGGPELILIFILALIVFGPKELPEIGRKVGGLVREFRKATGEFRVNLEREIGFDPVTGLEVTKKARRELLTSVTEPIREVTEGTIETVREARKEATAALTVARTLPPPKPATLPPPVEPPPGIEIEKEALLPFPKEAPVAGAEPGQPATDDAPGPAGGAPSSNGSAKG